MISYGSRKRSKIIIVIIIIWTIRVYPIWAIASFEYGLVYRAFSLTWPAAMQIYWNKRKCLHKKRVQVPRDWFGTPTWPPFHCFGTPIWLPWRHAYIDYIMCLLYQYSYKNIDPITQLRQTIFSIFAAAVVNKWAHFLVLTFSFRSNGKESIIRAKQFKLTAQ